MDVWHANLRVGQSSVKAWQNPNTNAKTTGKRRDPFETQDIIIGRVDWTLLAPQLGSEEQCVVILMVSVSQLEGFVLGINFIFLSCK